jgi:hypothetical protein
MSNSDRVFLLNYCFEPTDIEAFDSLLVDVTLAVKPIFEMKVLDYETELSARQAGGQISTLLKRLDARREELLAPLKSQMDAINTAAKRVKEALSEPEMHIRNQLNSYAAEVKKKREEELRLKRERDELERRTIEEKRRKEHAELLAKQQEERKKKEAEELAEQQRIRDELEAKRREAEQHAANKAAAAALFGGGNEAQEKAEREAAEAKRNADEKAREEEKIIAQKAEANRRALADQHERERLAKEARIQREESERQKALEEEHRQIEAQKVKGAKLEIIIEVIDPWLVPRQYLRAPEVQVSEVKKAYKAGLFKELPGLIIREESKVTLRSVNFNFS